MTNTTAQTQTATFADAIDEIVAKRIRWEQGTEHCGGGAELGLSSTSEDGLSTAEFRIIMDRVGSSNRSNFALNLEHRF